MPAVFRGERNPITTAAAFARSYLRRSLRVLLPDAPLSKVVTHTFDIRGHSRSIGFESGAPPQGVVNRAAREEKADRGSVASQVAERYITSLFLFR